MARKGSAERGLVERKSKGGKVWYVRVYPEGRGHWFGPLKTKTDAQNLYRIKKVEQYSGKFGLCRGEALLKYVVNSYRATNEHKTAKQDTCYAVFWIERVP